MAENQPNTLQASNLPVMIHAQYVKDLSFENPAAPFSLKAGQENPKMDVAINLDAKPIADTDIKSLYEVVLRLSANSKRGDQTLYIAEVHYGVTVSMPNVEEQHHHPLLLVEIPNRNVILIPFEEDIAALYKCFDIYVHTPVDELCEAFGQTYVEALASGIPSIFTLSGIAAQFIKHDKNAYVAEFKNSDAIYHGLEKMWNDVSYRNQLIEGGRQSTFPRFENEPTIIQLKQLYNA